MTIPNKLTKKDAEFVAKILKHFDGLRSHEYEKYIWTVYEFLQKGTSIEDDTFTVETLEVRMALERLLGR